MLVQDEVGRGISVNDRLPITFRVLRFAPIGDVGGETLVLSLADSGDTFIVESWFTPQASGTDYARLAPDGRTSVPVIDDELIERLERCREVVEEMTSLSWAEKVLPGLRQLGEAVLAREWCAP